MARMIPAYFDDTTPPGERSVFNYLASAPADWLVLHSLDLAPRNRGIRTEIDFVVVVPDAGVLCIEVKSHEGITFDGERWYPDSIKKSPFKQALDARYCFYRSISEVFPKFRRIPVSHCCIFPRSSFEISNTSVTLRPWELIDRRTFERLEGGSALAAELKKRLLEGIDADSFLQRLDSPLGSAEIEQVISFCTPVQRRRPGLRDEIHHREQEADRLLKEQQRSVLQLATLNRRLVVTGGAGTGKTLIALELAARFADAGQRVALLCFNQLIGNWLEERARSLTRSPSLVAGRAIKVLAGMADITIPSAPSQAFWDRELPNAIQERFTDPDWAASATFDVVILDEAQDLVARPVLWDCVSLLVDGGTSGGRFILLGDFENQVLADKQAMLEKLSAIEADARPAHWRLSDNCRNYRIVGEMAVNLGGLDRTTYDRYLKIGGGVQNYSIAFYSTEDEQEVLVRHALNQASMLGYRASEVTILSFAAPENSVGGRLRQKGVALRPAWQPGSATMYTFVSAFKGMESKVAILTDVDLADSAFSRNLLYTGITRATDVVRVFCRKSCIEILEGWMEAAE